LRPIGTRMCQRIAGRLRPKSGRVRADAFSTRSVISSNRPNNCTWMCRLGRSEAGCRSVSVRVTPLTRRGRARVRIPEQPDQTTSACAVGSELPRSSNCGSFLPAPGSRMSGMLTRSSGNSGDALANRPQAGHMRTWTSRDSRPQTRRSMTTSAGLPLLKSPRSRC
jgi:hypothetical protein